MLRLSTFAVVLVAIVMFFGAGVAEANDPCACAPTTTVLSPVQPVAVTAYYTPAPTVAYFPRRVGLFGRRIVYR